MMGRARLEDTRDRRAVVIRVLAILGVAVVIVAAKSEQKCRKTPAFSRRALLGSDQAPTPSPPPPTPAPFNWGDWARSLFFPDSDTVSASSGPGGGRAPSSAAEFTAPSVNSTFVRQLLEEAQALQDDRGLPPRPAPASGRSINDDMMIDANIQEALCDSEFLRGVLNQTKLDAAFTSANPLHEGGRLPMGCVTGA